MISPDSARSKLRVVFLTGADSRSTVMAVDAVCRLRQVEPVAILLDTFAPPLKTRFRNFRRNLKREGLGFVPVRLLEAFARFTDGAVQRVFPKDSARNILRKAFPDRCFTLNDVSRNVGARLIEVGNLNSQLAARTLAELNADLGIVLGTRVLKRSTFGVPRLGSVNLHKGSVPDYRGTPPGFWEMYNGEKTAGVTVHFVDDTLDTGDIVAQAKVDILPLDTPDSMLTKLHLLGAETLAGAITAVASGSVTPAVQSQKTGRKPYTKPTRAQVSELRRRLPHWSVPSPASVAAKNAAILAIYYSGAFSLVRAIHQRQRTRGSVVLYHRVNDVSCDGVTTGLERFAAHMDMIARWYKPMASSEMVARLHDDSGIPPTSVAVHFDDCYKDVYQNAVPIMQCTGVPGAAFVNSGFVGTDRVFAHDLKRSPFRFENLTATDLRSMLASGFEIGAHTVNHVDLGSCPIEEARKEIADSVRELEAITGQPVPLFSFPFGRECNIRPELTAAVKAAGCSCMFSAFGGTVSEKTDLYDIHRFGASDMHAPLHLALEIEGISPRLLVKRLRRGK